jgi:hypothetical protein
MKYVLSGKRLIERWYSKFIATNLQKIGAVVEFSWVHHVKKSHPLSPISQLREEPSAA